MHRPRGSFFSQLEHFLVVLILMADGQLGIVDDLLRHEEVRVKPAIFDVYNHGNDVADGLHPVHPD